MFVANAILASSELTAIEVMADEAGIECVDLQVVRSWIVSFDVPM